MKMTKPEVLVCQDLSMISPNGGRMKTSMHSMVTSVLTDPTSLIKGNDVMANAGIVLTADHSVIEPNLNNDSISDDNVGRNESEVAQYESIIYVNNEDGDVTDDGVLLSAREQGSALHLDQTEYSLADDHGDLASDILPVASLSQSKHLVGIPHSALSVADLTTEGGTMPTLMMKTATGEYIQVIPVQNFDDFSGITCKSDPMVTMVPMSVGNLQSALLVTSNGDSEDEGRQMVGIGSGMHITDSISHMLVHDQRVLPPGTPDWANRINECERIGDSYRGWVESEAELDLLLTYHKQQTNSFWGTRQSPSPAKPSTRLMWKSQYVHFDGVPFVNAGSRAIVLECQFGPRRKGAQAKRQLGENYKGEFRKTCPARIYIKKVKKFPEYAININQDKKMMKIAMDEAFMYLRERGLEQGGQERFYVQLPTEAAHEFHSDDSVEGPHRLDPRVSNKIRHLVSMGETRLYVIRRALRTFVEKEMFSTNEQLPEKHNLSFYPTVNDLQNHIHQAFQDIEACVLPIKANHMLVEMMSGADDSSDQAGLENRSGARTESVTVTLTQSPNEEGHHVISKVETHMSDGSTEVTTNLTPETARLLSRLHPNLFPSQSSLAFGSQLTVPSKRSDTGQITHTTADDENISLAHSPTQYVVMENCNDMKITLQGVPTAMMMDEDIVNSLKTESTDLSHMESDSLVKLEEPVDVMSHYQSDVDMLASDRVMGSHMQDDVAVDMSDADLSSAGIVDGIVADSMEDDIMMDTDVGQTCQVIDLQHAANMDQLSHDLQESQGDC